MKNDNRDLDRILDRWLEQSPIAPSPHRTDAIVNRVHQEITAMEDSSDSIDQQIDAWLADHPIPTTEARTEAMVRAINESLHTEEKPTFLGMPTWAFVLGSMAATLILGILGFAFLMHQASQQNPKENWARHQEFIHSPPSTVSPTPPPQTRVAAAPATPPTKTELTMLDEILYAETRLHSNSDWMDEPSWESMTYSVMQ